MRHKLITILLLLLCGFSYSQIQFETDFGQTGSTNPSDGKAENAVVFDNKIFLTAARFGLTQQYIYTYNGSTYEATVFDGTSNQVAVNTPSFETRENSSSTMELWITAPTSTSTYAGYITAGGNSVSTVISGGIIEGLQEEINNEIYNFGNSSSAFIVITDQAGSASIAGPLFTAGSISAVFGFNGKLYLSASTGSDGVELYEYDRGTDTASLVSDINTSGDSNPSDFIEANGKFYFTADPGTGRELYVFDPNAISKVSKIDIVASNAEDPQHLTYYQSGANTYIILSADAGASIGREPVRINTANDSATLLSVRSGADSSDPAGFTVYNGFVYFSANDGTDGVELFRTNGTAVGTTQVSNINTSGDSNPNSFLEFNSELYFQADGDGVGVELHKVNASNIVSLVEDFLTGTDSFNPVPLIVYGNRLYMNGQSNSTTKHLYSYKPRNTYVGAAGGDWFVGSNWSDGVVPDANTSVIIPASSNVQVSTAGAECLDLDTSYGASALFIAPGASLTVKRDWISSASAVDLELNNLANLSSTLGAPSFIVERNLIAGNGRIQVTRKQPANQWLLVSSPLKDAAINDYSSQFATGTGSNIGFAPYNNNLTSPWEYFTVGNITGNFDSGKGYSTLLTTDSGVYLGNYNPDNTSISITDGTVSNWNLVGNPFTAAIAGNNNANATNNVILDNDSEFDPSFKALYFWDATANSGSGAYQVINHTSASYHIPIGQGFFINAKSGGGTFTFNEALQSHQTGTDNFRNANTTTPEIKILAVTNNSTQSTLVKYVTNSTRGLDPGYDAGRFNGIGSDFKIYTQLISDNQGIEFGLQVLPIDYENLEVPIGLKASANDQITFSAEAQSLPQNLMIFLEDKDTNTITRLDQQGTNYQITLTSNYDGAGRFFLHTSTSNILSTNNPESQGINLYVSQRHLRADGLSSGEYHVEVYNIFGQSVFDEKVNVDSGIDLAIPNHIRTGIYIVKLSNKEASFSRKVILE